MSETTTTRQVLGQRVALGDLWNAYDNVAIQNVNIFDNELPQELFTVEDEIIKNFATVMTDFKHDKFAALGIQPETGASVIASTLVPTGASAFLINHTKSNRINQVSAICTVQMSMKRLVLDDPEELNELVNLQAVEAEGKNATHGIIGIQQGARLAVSVENTTDITADTAKDMKLIVSGIEQCFMTNHFDYSETGEFPSKAGIDDIPSNQNL